MGKQQVQLGYVNIKACGISNYISEYDVHQKLYLIREQHLPVFVGEVHIAVGSMVAPLSGLCR